MFWLDALRNSTVRDLAWAVGSPGLLDPRHPPFAATVGDEFLAAEVDYHAELLRSLETCPTSLTDWLDDHHTHRLGHYFEHLLAFWLMSTGAVNLRMRLAVGPADRREGEFDLLFEHPRWGGLFHWEVAVKFYLCLDAQAGLKGFIGPNPQDRLADKLNRLFGHQLQLANTAAGRAVIGTGTPPRAQAVVKGWLFFPLGKPKPSVPGLSGRAMTGWWLRHGQEELPQEEGARWKVLPQLSWLAPALAQEGERTLFDALHLKQVLDRHFARASTPLLLARLARAGDGLWHETSRGFVVGPRWPEEGGASGDRSGLRRFP